METPHSLSTGALMTRIGLFVLIGTPLVAFLWQALNHLLAGRIVPLELLLFLPALLLLYILLRFMARAIESWDSARTEPDRSER